MQEESSGGLTAAGFIAVDWVNDLERRGKEARSR
jgi:hypothetical protein